MTSRRPVAEKRPTAGARGEDDLTRLIRIIARQAAQEAFALFRDALEAPPLENLPLLDRSKLKHAQREQFLSVAEVAEKLGVSEKTVRRKIASGDWPADRIGKLVRINEHALTASVTRARCKRDEQDND